MDLSFWIALFVAESAFAYWIVYGGGAAWLEGWKSFFLVHMLAPRWSAEGIRLFAFVSWWLALGWFVLGLIRSDLRVVM